MVPGVFGLTSDCASKFSSVQNPGRDLHCLQCPAYVSQRETHAQILGKICVAALAPFLPSQLPTLAVPNSPRSWGWGAQRQMMSCWEHRDIRHGHSPKDELGIRQIWWYSSMSLGSVFQDEEQGWKAVGKLLQWFQLKFFSCECLSVCALRCPKVGFGVLRGKWLEPRNSWRQVWGEEYKMHV